MKPSRTKQISAKEVLLKLGDTMIEIAKGMNTDSTISLEQLVKAIKKLQANLETRPLQLEKIGLFDKKIFPSKQSIVAFVEQFYNERIPTSWSHEKVLKRATQIVGTHGVDIYDSCLGRYTSFSVITKGMREMNVFAMELEDIKKEFENPEKYPTVASIRQALPSSLRGILKDVTNKDYAIKKLVDEMKQLRSVSRIQDIFSKGT